MIANCLHLLFELAGSPSSVKRGSPVSVYLFPGEGQKSCTSALEGEDSELDQLVVTATEVHADMMSEECSEGSTDNDDFCILEAPGIGIPVSAVCSDYFCSSLLSYMDFDTLLSSICHLWHLEYSGKIKNRIEVIHCFVFRFIWPMSFSAVLAGLNMNPLEFSFCLFLFLLYSLRMESQWSKCCLRVL